MRIVALVAAVVIAFGLASAATAQVPAPLAIKVSSVGGGALNQYTPGVFNGVGLNNIGLLIRTWGKVTFVDTTNKYFYIDDGSNRLDGSTQVGVRVSYDNLAAGNVITPPALNSFVLLTGISSTVMIDNKVQPNVRPRRQDDIQTVAP